MLRIVTACALVLGLAACADQPSEPMASRPVSGVAAAPPTSQTGSAGYQGTPLVGHDQAIAPVNAGQTGSKLSHPGY